MKPAYAFAIAVLLTVTPAAQDQERVPYAVDLERRQIVEAELSSKLRAGVETRTTKGAPYSAEAISEFVQVLADGNKIVRKSVTRIYRDAEGRTRREQTSTTGGEERQTITISDPIAGTSLILDPQTRTAYRSSPTLALSTAAAEKVKTEQRQRAVVEKVREASPAAAPTPEITSAGGGARIRVAQPTARGGDATREDLGIQTIEGVAAQGTRTTTVIAAGAIGNDQPIKIVSEQWFSPDLQVLVMTKHSDPRSGETLYRLTNIVRVEPDRSLFDVPVDYTVKESARRPLAPVMRKQ